MENDQDLDGVNRRNREFWDERNKAVGEALESPAVAESARQTIERELATIPSKEYVRLATDLGTAALNAQAARRPAWDVWRQVPVIRIWEGVALSLDIEPTRVKHDSMSADVEQHLFNESPTFESRVLIARRNVDSGVFNVISMPSRDPAGAHVKLDQFTAWAVSTGWELPEGFGYLPGGHPPIPGFDNDIPTVPTADEGLGSRERGTLLTLIAALAKEAKIDIDKPSKAAALIEQLTEQIGSPVAARTIENHLKRIPEALDRRSK